MSNETKKPVLELVNSAKKPAGKKPNNTGGSGGSGSSTKQKRFGEYGIVGGAFAQFRMMRVDGSSDRAESSFPLCNFTARIIEEVLHDDGLTDSSFLRIEGRRADGLVLPVADVPSKNFYSTQGSWPNDAWGIKVAVNPGAAKRDNLRFCLHQYSNLEADVPSRIVYKYTGWKKINEQWHYLTGSGAITAAGLVDTVETDLGSGHMSRYALPAPLAGDELRAAINETLQLMTICPNKPHIGAVLLAAVARAPLGECQPTNYVIWTHGLTGSGKSELAALCLAFFGKEFNSNSFPSNWSDTDNAMESKAYRAKDGLFVVDDYKPSVSPTEAAKLNAKAERFVRGTGNQAARDRLASSLDLNSGYYNRSLTLITGEDLPKGQSLLARSLILEIARPDIPSDQLPIYKQAAQSGKYAGLMSAYIQWLASRMDQLKAGFPRFVQQYQNDARNNGLTTSHPRAPEIYANMVAGAETFIDFLQDSGLSAERANVLTADIETGLKQAFSEQGAYQSEQDEVQRFINLLKAAFSSGNCHIAERLKKAPPEKHPFFWGWRNAGTDAVGDDMYSPMGDCIGYLNEQTSGKPCEVWLVQDNAFKVAAQFARNQGDSFLLSAPALWRRMVERGLVIQTEPDAKTNKPRTTVQQRVAGVKMRVMVLSSELFEAD